MDPATSHVFEVDLRNAVSIRVTKLLVLAVLGLFSMHWAGLLATASLGEDHIVSRNLVKLFWLDRENNIPAWFSSCLLWTCGILLLQIGAFRTVGNPGLRTHWLVLGCVFIVLSMDEAVAMHEWLIVPVREMLGVGGLLYFAWVVPALIVLAIGAAAYIPFLRALPMRLAVLFFVAGAIFVFGAIGLEMVGGAASDEVISRSSYQIVMPFEELLEMLGLVVFLHGLTAVLAAE